MRLFDFMALAQGRAVDPSIAIAASRAGAVGMLNLEYARDPWIARTAIRDLARWADRRCGIVFDSQTPPLVEALLPDLSPQFRVAMLTCTDTKNWPAMVSACRQQGLEVFLQVTNIQQMYLAVQLEADALVAKGHESGGWVDGETTFVLLQRLISISPLPVWAQGGIGLHTVAACYVAGAAGAVLDSQLALARESPLPEIVKEAIAAMDGSETTCIGTEIGAAFRVYARPGADVVQALNEQVADLVQSDRPRDEATESWHTAVSMRVGWGALDEHVWPLGQDAVFAKPLAQRYVTVGGILGAMRDAITSHVRVAGELCPLDADSPLAISHGCHYPIVQGPMTRVSDKPSFALRVAEEGGLPFLALGLMRAPEVEALLSETQRLLAGRPWGVGILGFVPLARRQEQLEVVRKYRPSHAIVAGGRPDQAYALERDGIRTYLHVPSPGLLRLFIQDGARRFVFEGHECGGHVGPRSSFVLWETAIDVILETLPAGDEQSCHVLFAGGLHDSLSSAMVAALAAPLAARGVRIGMLMGTAYLFTREAVTTGATVPGFQQAALECDSTVLLESGPGHVTRCVPTPFASTFEQERLRLQADGKSPEETRQALEELNVGRLRIAAKGITRHARYGRDPAVPKFVAVSPEDQHREGLYMIGQVAASHDRVCTLAELHYDVTVAGMRQLRQISAEVQSAETVTSAKPSQVAIVGISAILPKAKNLQAFWENILNRVDAITEVPKDRWDADLYYSADRTADDKIYSRWGGFIEPVPFDPLEFGIPPNSLASIDPVHLLALVATREALKDAGYDGRPFDRSQTSVILGASGGTGDQGAAYLLRAGLPLLFGEQGFELAASAGDVLPEWTEDSFAGLLLNVTAGRIANRFDLGGLNFVVDAACASSLAAIHLAVKELEIGNTDMVIAGGVDTVQTPFGYLCFSKTQALSPTGQPRVFDAEADGIVISEGLVMLVLKRLADAERDGDRVYAVIQAVGGSSDGRGMGMTAPRPEGQMLAMKRAYAKAGYSPTTVALFEAHGTGTSVGDLAEAQSLARLLEGDGALPGRHAVGSVKSMIGHTKATAGVAGLAKVALSLYHKVLPPTLHVTRPNPRVQFGATPLYVNSETRPWLRSLSGHPRRAGVSAFGFGGTNFHAAIEEYTGDFLANRRPAVFEHWPTELFLWRGTSRRQLAEKVQSLAQALDQGARPALHDLAYTLARAATEQPGSDLLGLAIVADSLQDLWQKLGTAETALHRGDAGMVHIDDPRGIYFNEEPLVRAGKVAFLFPGQGSQYPNMLRDLAVQFAGVREAFELVDEALADRFTEGLSRFIFPRPAFTDEEKQEQIRELTQTDRAQPALGAAGVAMMQLLDTFGVRPDLVAGHSYGEYVALWAAGVIDVRTLAVLSEARGRAIVEAAEDDLGTMAAARASAGMVASVVAGVEGVWIANRNAPTQTVVSGTHAGVTEAVHRLEAAGIGARLLPVACAFHSPLVAPAQERLAEVLAGQAFATPAIPVFSNTTADPYPKQPEAIRELLAQHLVRPVRFAEQLEAMYEAGARIFVEAGPRNVLAGLTDLTLGERPHLAVITDQPARPGVTALLHALGRLAAEGVLVQPAHLFRGRQVRRLNLTNLAQETGEEPLPATVWLVNGNRARPPGAPPPAAYRPPLEFSPPPGVASDEQPAATPDASTKLPTVQKARQRPTPAALPPAAGATGLRPAASSSDDGTTRVMLQFQQLMSQFLETQRSVMLDYLQGDSVPQGTSPLATQSAESVDAARGLDDEHATAAAEGMESREAEEIPSTIPDTETAETVSVDSDACAVEAAQAPFDATAAPPAFDKEALEQQLLQIVSERTGYPPEMLHLDVDIEAQLGIDSIKRVEILGALRRSYLPDDQQPSPEAMERLTAIKTLAGIVDWFERTLQPPEDRALVGDTRSPGPLSQAETVPSSSSGSEEAPTDLASSQFRGSQQAEMDVPRSLITVRNAPRISGTSPVFPSDRCIVITDDGRGTAAAMAAMIRDRGGRAILLRTSGGPAGAGEGVYEADLADGASVADLVARVRQQQGPIAGLVYLLPLREQPDVASMDLTAWRQQARRQVKSLFYLARATASDLKQASESGSAWLVATSAMGGSFAMDPAEARPFLPIQAGLAGLCKTVAQEWPAVHCKVIDMDSQDPAEDCAARVLAEMAADDGLVEVGYRGTQRQTLAPQAAPLDEGADRALAIGPDWVILVTGGARGITAEAACELAERYRPTLLLVGTSAPAEDEESPRTAGLGLPQEIKAALMAQMREASQDISLRSVEAAYGSLMKAREMRQNLARMRQAGARVRYYQADVRDESTMRDLIAGIYTEYGRLDGVIHGAGIIEDKLIEDKQPESFDRVFDTKADSAFLLSKTLRPDTLKFLVFFSSAAGAFGNRGQADYAATNEVVNKLAMLLDRTWPGRIVSINWGPWLKRGMVSQELERQFAARGIQLISLGAGRRLLEREIRLGKKGDAEVIIAGGAWGATPPGLGVEAVHEAPLLARAILSNGDTGETRAFRRLDSAYDLYLADHRLDGRPVLPMAVAVEMMSEVVSMGWPDLHIHGLSGLQVLRGVVLEHDHLDVVLAARAGRQQPQARTGIDVHVEIQDPAGGKRPFYRATVHLGDVPSAPPERFAQATDGLQPFPLSVEQAYGRWLFHGPLLQGIRDIEGLSDQWLTATLQPSTPARCLRDGIDGEWLIDPVVLDSGLQLIILWSRAHYDMTPLPLRFRRYRRFGPLGEGPIHCSLQATAEDAGHIVHANLYFLGQDGRPRGVLEDLECGSSKALNRLAGQGG